MYRLINAAFDRLNRWSPILIQTPNPRSFGNGSEEMWFGLLKAQRENKKVLFLYPRLSIFGKRLSVANRELFHLRSPQSLSNKDLLGVLGGCLLSLYILFFRVLYRMRSSPKLRGFVRRIWPRIAAKAERDHGYLVPQIGRSAIWKPSLVNFFSWDIVEKLNWESQLATYQPPKLAEDKKNRAEQIRLRMGIPLNDWFVIIHVSENDPPTVRNANIHNYLEAIHAITQAGGWVVRLGESTMTPLPPMERVIDYAHTPYKSDLMDLYLISECRFFVGLASGPTFTAALFDKPQILVNMTDWSMGVPLKKGNLTLIKHVFSRSRGRFLSIKEILEEPYAVTVFNRVYHDDSDDYVIVENTAEEIREVVEEFLAGPQDSVFEFSPLQVDFNEARQRAVRRWIEEGEPRWVGSVEGDTYLDQYRIASRLHARGTLGRRYLEKNWLVDELEKSHQPMRSTILRVAL